MSSTETTQPELPAKPPDTFKGPHADAKNRRRMSAARLYKRIMADRTGLYANRTGPLSEAVLQAQEQRLDARLPAQLRDFYLAVGSGDFLFGYLFSPVVASDGLSELENELEQYNATEPTRPALTARLQLLPFCRRVGWLYLFDLTGHSAPNTVWSWDSEAPGEGPEPLEASFFEWVQAKFDRPWEQEPLRCQILLAADAPLPERAYEPGASSGLQVLSAQNVGALQQRTGKKFLHWVSGAVPPSRAGTGGYWPGYRLQSDGNVKKPPDSDVQDSYRKLSEYLDELRAQGRAFELLAVWPGEESSLSRYQLALGQVDVEGRKRDIVVGQAIKFG